MTISLFSSPMYLREDIDYILSSQSIKDPRIIKALRDLSNDLEAMQEMIKIVSRWEIGDCSDKTLLAGYNEYCSKRGVVRYG